MPAFHRFPNEAAIIGRLLAGYAEIEIALLHCVAQATGDFDATLKAMFGLRGETRRIDRAEKLGRETYRDLNLKEDFDSAIRATRDCLTLRNRYAHCNWYDDNTDCLAYVNVEELAGEKGSITGFDPLTRYYVNVPTLREQERYFAYTDALLAYTNYEGRFRRGLIKKQVFLRPAEQSSPPLHAGTFIET